MRDEDKKSGASEELSDEARRKLYKPSVTPAQATTIIQALYAKPDGSDTIEVVRQLDSYDDVNFMVKLNDTLHLLKIHNGVESEDFLRAYEAAGHEYNKTGHMGSVIHLQTAIMDLLSVNDIPTSANLPTQEGMPVGLYELPVVSSKDSPRQLVVRLLSWVHGKLMASVPLMPVETIADTGRLLGKVHLVLNKLDQANLQSINILKDAPKRVKRRASLVQGREAKEDMVITDKIRQAQMWKIPDSGLDESLLRAARRYHQWDGKNTADLRNFVHHVTDEKRRSIVISIIDTFQHELIDSGDAQELRVGVNHGDFNDANVLLADDLSAKGVIDFGDSVESWRVLDVTVAMAYAMLSTYGKGNRSVSAAAAMLRGYQVVNPLTVMERKHLVLLVACRLACSATLGAYSFQQNPENTYLLLHAEPAWKALEMIWCYSTEQRDNFRVAFDSVLDQACLYGDARGPVIDCADLLCADPIVSDMLASVRVQSFQISQPSPKKRRLSIQGLPIITFVTGNVKKLEEVQQILRMDYDGYDESRLPFTLNHHKVDLPELQGNPVEIARQKCKLAAEKLDCAVITEDTSLCFQAMGNLPGPYIKWYLEGCGLEGLNKMLDGFTDRSAYAQTIVCFSAGPGHDPAIFDGRTAGTIVRSRGPLNFGWDPIFEPDQGHGKTYAEMTLEEKNAISHRSRAFIQLRSFLKAQQGTLKGQIA